MTTKTTTPVGLGKALVAGLVGGLIGAVINVIIYFVFQGINGGPLLVTPPGSTGPEPLALPILLFASIMPGVVAGALYWALAKFTANPNRWFLIVAVIVCIASIFTPLTGGVGAVTIWALELTHVGAAVPIVASLLRLQAG